MENLKTETNQNLWKEADKGNVPPPMRLKTNVNPKKFLAV